MPSPRQTMNLLALLLAAAVTGYWWSAGGHRGWSMDKVPIARTDEITGLEYTEYEDRFVPGVEVLGGGLVAAAVCAGIALFLRKSAQSR